jgi:hypothetical protein
MSTTAFEQVPTTWDDGRDAAFLALVARAFETDVLSEAAQLFATRGMRSAGDRGLVPAYVRLRRNAG